MKRPSVRHLEMARPRERQRLMPKGRIAFYDPHEGRRRIELPLKINVEGKPATLQGVYKLADGSILTMRACRSSPLNPSVPSIWFFTVGEDGVERPHRELGYAYRGEHMGHVRIPPRLRGQGLGTRAVARTEAEYRAGRGGRLEVWVDEKSVPVFRRNGYREVARRSTADAIIPGKGESTGPYQEVLMVNDGTPQLGEDPVLHDMDKYHIIEAVDPKTGKPETFRIKA